MAITLEAGMLEGTTSPDFVLAFLAANHDLIRLQCKAESQAWFEQIRTNALVSSHAYDKALETILRLLGAETYPTALKGKIAMHGARAAYLLADYVLAESLGTVADSLYVFAPLYSAADAAMIRVNLAWSRLRLGRDQEAECLFLRAQRVLYAHNQTGRTPLFLHQADSGLYVAHGNPNLCEDGDVIKPIEPGEEHAGPWLAACLLLTIVLAFVAGRVLRRTP